MKTQLLNCNICAEDIGPPYACFLSVCSVSMSSCVPRLVDSVCLLMLYLILWFLNPSSPPSTGFPNLHLLFGLETLHLIPLLLGETLLMTLMLGSYQQV